MANPTDQPTAPAAKQPITVLIVEDDSFISTFLSDKFAAGPFTPVVANTTSQATAMLEANTVHCILLDIIMPGEDGLTWLKTLTANPRYRDIPVIIISNLSDQRHIDQANKLGAVDYIIKAQLTPEAIVRRVTSYLQQHHPSLFA